MSPGTSDLGRRFRPLEAYRTRAGNSYSLLPFRFSPLDHTRYVLTNFAGEYVVLPRDPVHAFIRHRLPPNSDIFRTLKAKHFLLEADSTVAIDLLAAKYRTKQAFLSQFTSLFMFVTTLRCDHSCVYCQVSRQAENQRNYDMSLKVAEKAIDFMFRSPSPMVKVEFQGGESLLNFDVVKYVVLKSEERNQTAGRNLEFVIATNLSGLTEEMLAFCQEHGVFISTSLDGPRDLHNKNRPRLGRDSYDEVTRGLSRAREALGPNKVSALMTTSRESLSQPREIVDEYVRQGFSSIFLRILNPYGRAASFERAQGYTVDEWLRFYQEALAHILELNRRGTPFREEFACLLLRKMLTLYATGFVDLQSPAGLGISGIILNYDGSVYPADEARMLAEMGDKSFYMGSVLTDSYRDIMLSPALLGPLSETVAECVPQCADCGFLPYCGSDPVRHYRTQGDVVGFKPTSEFCKKNMAVLRHLISLLEDDEAAASVLRHWV